MASWSWSSSSSSSLSSSYHSLLLVFLRATRRLLFGVRIVVLWRVQQYTKRWEPAAEWSIRLVVRRNYYHHSTISSCTATTTTSTLVSLLAEERRRGSSTTSSKLQVALLAGEKGQDFDDDDDDEWSLYGSQNETSQDDGKYYRSFFKFFEKLTKYREFFRIFGFETTLPASNQCTNQKNIWRV